MPGTMRVHAFIPFHVLPSQTSPFYFTSRGDFPFKTLFWIGFPGNSVLNPSRQAVGPSLCSCGHLNVLCPLHTSDGIALSPLCLPAYTGLAY